MAGGLNREDALAEAQHRGIAEADPSLDIGGFDTANKLVGKKNSHVAVLQVTNFHYIIAHGYRCSVDYHGKCNFRNSSDARSCFGYWSD